MIKKIQGLVAMIIVASVFFWCYHSYAQNREEIMPKEEIEKEIEMETSSADVVIWYSDSALENYLKDISETYFKKNNVSVAAIYVSSVWQVGEYNISECLLKLIRKSWSIQLHTIVIIIGKHI